MAVTDPLHANDSHRLCLLCFCVKHLTRFFHSLEWRCGVKQKAGVPRPTPAEQRTTRSLSQCCQSEVGTSSKLNENLPAITEPWEWGMCFKRTQLNGRALLLAHQCLLVVMQYLSLSMQAPLTQIPPVQSRSSGHRSTPEAVIYSFLHFYKLSLTLNLAQTAVTSDKNVWKEPDCFSDYSLGSIANTTAELIFLLWHVQLMECRPKSCSKLLYKYPVLLHFKTELFPCRENVPLGNTLPVSLATCPSIWSMCWSPKAVLWDCLSKQQHPIQEIKC